MKLVSTTVRILHTFLLWNIFLVFMLYGGIVSELRILYFGFFLIWSVLYLVEFMLPFTNFDTIRTSAFTTKVIGGDSLILNLTTIIFTFIQQLLRFKFALVWLLLNYCCFLAVIPQDFKWYCITVSSISLARVPTQAPEIVVKKIWTTKIYFIT